MAATETVQSEEDQLEASRPVNFDDTVLPELRVRFPLASHSLLAQVAQSIIVRHNRLQIQAEAVRATLIPPPYNCWQDRETFGGEEHSRSPWVHMAKCFCCGLVLTLDQWIDSDFLIEHEQQDMKPWVCISEKCDNLEFFTSFEAWVDHLKIKHVDNSFETVHCETTSLQMPRTPKEGECPFCLEQVLDVEWPAHVFDSVPISSQTDRMNIHVSNHLCELALLSLPEITRSEYPECPDLPPHFHGPYDEYQKDEDNLPKFWGELKPSDVTAAPEDRYWMLASLLPPPSGTLIEYYEMEKKPATFDIIFHSPPGLNLHPGESESEYSDDCEDSDDSEDDEDSKSDEEEENKASPITESVRGVKTRFGE